MALALQIKRLELDNGQKKKGKKMSKKSKVMAVRVFGISTMVGVNAGWIAIIKMAFIG